MALTNQASTIGEFGIQNSPFIDKYANACIINSYFTKNYLFTLPVLNEEKKIEGVVSLIDVLKLEEPFDNYLAEDIMTKTVISLTYDSPLIQSIEVFASKHHISNRLTSITSIPITDIKDNQFKFIGILDSRLLINNFRNILSKYKVSELISREPYDVIDINDDVTSAYFFLNSTGNRQLLVTNYQKGDNYPVGIISDIQVLKQIKTNNRILIRDAMTPLNYFKILTPRHKITRFIDIMQNQDVNLKIFPIVEAGKLISVVSYTDLLSFLLKVLKSTAINASMPISR